MATTGRGTLGNLPAEVTSFVGRRREIGEVQRLLGESRLVTLTGAGGTGKTRLAVRVGAKLRRAFADGVWFVDLTELHEPGLLQNAQDLDAVAFLVTATLGLRERGGGSPLQVLVGQLADRQLLLILDNCEHLLPASVILADALLRVGQDLRVLATSREPLAVVGEVLLPVWPLPTPDPGHLPSLADMGRCEAVALFLARAQAVSSAFQLTEANHLAVADLCHRLDGLPLAIELAAARVRALAPQQILDRLTDRFAVLSRGDRAAPGRHQTLRACVDWSFELCAKPEQILWRRLSVFAGGFEVDAVQGVCAADDEPEADLQVLVAALVDKSILVRDDVRAGAVRYRMLETIRDYGQDRLHEAGEDAVLRRRHRDWYERLVAHAHGEWVSDRQAYWLARLRREHPNLRVAMEYDLTEPGEAEATLRLAVSLPMRSWSAGGLFGEGRRWLDRALAQGTAATAVRARACLLNALFAWGLGDAAAGMRLLDEGEELARRLDAGAELAYTAFLRGLGALLANDLPVAVQTLTRAWTTLSRAPESDLDLYLTVVLTLGTAAAMAGDHEGASACVRDIMAIVEPRGEGIYRSYGLWLDGLIAWRRGDVRQAGAQVVGAVRLKRAWESDDRSGVALCLETLAWITAGQQRYLRAATLLGAADTLWTDLGTPITAFGHFIGYHTACERQTRDGLGDTAFQQALHEGRVLTYDDAIAYALNEPRQPAPVPPADAPAPLTRRERQVADLIAQGLRNKDIAAALVISQRTAEAHVKHILTKLGFTSRTQVAGWVAARSTEENS